MTLSFPNYKRALGKRQSAVTICTVQQIPLWHVTMEGFFDFFVFLLPARVQRCPLDPTASPWGQLALASARVLQATQFLTTLSMSFSEQVFTPEVSKFILCSSFAGPWDSDFLPWLFPSTACWVACFRTAAQGLWMDGCFSLSSVPRRGSLFSVPTFVQGTQVQLSAVPMAFTSTFVPRRVLKLQPSGCRHRPPLTVVALISFVMFSIRKIVSCF